MESIAVSQIESFLAELGTRYTRPASLVLLGGSALCLLGSERPTLDIDFVGDDLRTDELRRMIEQISQELRIPVDPVPIADFIPLPSGANSRRLSIGQFGLIQVYVLDPYTIALSKLDRGFDTDIEDILFLLRRNLITLEGLEEVVTSSLAQAAAYDMSPTDVNARLQTVRTLYK